MGGAAGRVLGGGHERPPPSPTSGGFWSTAVKSNLSNVCCLLIAVWCLSDVRQQSKVENTAPRDTGSGRHKLENRR